MTEPASTQPATVRRPVWHGVQPVAALWFAHAALGADARIARLFAEWVPGSQVLRFPEGDLLLFAEPRLRRCDECPGLPLCQAGGVLASGPVADDERRELADADIGIVAGARLIALNRSDGVAIDLAPHLDLDDYALHDTYDLAETLPPPAPCRLAGKNARDALGDAIPPASTERNAVLDALARRQDGKGARRLGWRGAIAGAVGGGLLMLDALRRLFAQRPASNPGGVALRAPAPARRPWRDFVARLAMLTDASALIGRRQAQHLARTLRQFEDGNLDAALRNALPLAGEGDAGDVGPSLGIRFLRRDALRLSAHGGGGSASVGVGEALMEYLRKLYRRAFETLDRAGRVDEAAFVLGELLGSKTEALDYLVKHSRAAQAAELALGWDLPAPTIVRLLLAAGDTARAVQVARRDNAFAAAVAQLEPQHAEAARLLRREWGRALVAQGDWLGAIDAIWPMTDTRELAAAWLLAAETAGVELSARALVRRAILLPETLAAHAERIEALAEPASVAGRTAVAQAIVDHRQRGDGVRALAAALLPAVAADRAAGANTFTRDALDRLASLAGNATLTADLPTWQLPPVAGGGRLIDRMTPLALPLPAAGLHAVYDAVRLRDDRWLVALGEAGVAVIDTSGRMLQRFAAPATQLVIAASRNVALAVAHRLTRIDLVRHTIVDLSAIRFRQFNETFDGIAWTVVSDDRILVLDTTTPACEVLWHVDLPGKIVNSRMTATGETYYLHTPDGGIQRWRYQQPGRRLTERKPLQVDVFAAMWLNPSGEIVPQTVSYDLAKRPIQEFEWNNKRRSVAFDLLPGSRCMRMSCFTTLLVLAFEHESIHRYFLIGLDGKIVATFDWPAVPMPHLREQDGHLLFFDLHGRLLDIDLATSLCRTISVV